MNAFEAAKGATLIMPSPGDIGMLSSLSIDLLIETLCLARVAEFNLPQLEQLAGTKVYSTANDANVVHSVLELYSGGDSLAGCYLLQCRSAPISGYSVSFSKDITSWIVKSGFKNVIFLTGLDKRMRNDLQITSTPIRFFSSSSHPLADPAKANDKHVLVQRAKAVKLKELENVEPCHNLYPVNLPPGSGCGQFVLNMLIESNMDVFVLTYFTESGDNNAASHSLAQAIMTLLLCEPVSLKTPPSWSRLYGAQLGKDMVASLF